MNNNDRERAQFWELQCTEAQANLKWMREQLAEAHRVIGILIITAGPSGMAPSLDKYFPGLYPSKQAPGSKAKKEKQELWDKAGA